MAFALLVTGCTSVLGLARTTSSPDGDGDGVLDAIDNCPDVANADQADADGNGIGDACEFCRIGADLDRDGIDDGCDACPRGPNDEDEDGDGVADACDTCPAVAGAQTDTDGDGIGDACDRSAAPQSRRFFDGFARVVPAWTSRVAWTIDGGAATSPGGADLELYAVRLTGTTPDLWSVTTGLTIPPESPAGVGTEYYAQVGVGLFDDTHLDDVFCGFAPTAGGWHLVVTQQGSTVKNASPFGAMTFVPGTHVALRVYLLRPSDQPELECEAGGDIARLVLVGEPARGIELRSVTSTRFDYADIIAP